MVKRKRPLSLKHLLQDIGIFFKDYKISDEEYEGILKEQFLLVLEQLFQTLSEREAQCIKEYYINDLTLNKIGEIIHLSKGRIGQIIAKGLRKLRHPKRFSFTSSS